MCMSARPANFSVTKLYAGEGEYKNKYVHVVAYQNNAESQNPYEANAMILPFPAAAPMDEKNVIDTRSFKNFLKDIAEASRSRGKTLGGARRSLTLGADSFSAAAVFDVGSYTVILAENAVQIPEALTRVSDEKRPSLSYRLLAGLDKLYHDQPLAVCCWSGSIQPEPLLWWYEPKNRNSLFMPTMDAHDGGAPDPEAIVGTDHVIMAGSSLKMLSGPMPTVHYRDEIPKQVKTLLPHFAFGSNLPHRMKNGDVTIGIDELTFKKDGKWHTPTAKRAGHEIAMWGWT